MSNFEPAFNKKLLLIVFLVAAGLFAHWLYKNDKLFKPSLPDYPEFSEGQCATPRVGIRKGYGVIIHKVYESLEEYTLIGFLCFDINDKDEKCIKLFQLIDYDIKSFDKHYERMTCPPSDAFNRKIK